MGQQRIALPLDESTFFLIDTFVLAASDLIKGVCQMTHDVKLVIDNLYVGSTTQRCFAKWLSHIHDCQLDGLAALRPHSVEEQLHMPVRCGPVRPARSVVSGQARRQRWHKCGPYGWIFHRRQWSEAAQKVDVAQAGDACSISPCDTPDPNSGY